MPQAFSVSAFIRERRDEIISEWTAALRELPRRRASEASTPAVDPAAVLEHVAFRVDAGTSIDESAAAATARPTSAGDERVLLRNAVLACAERHAVTFSWRDARLLLGAFDSALGARAERYRELAARAHEAERRSEAAAERQRFLAEASRVLGESLDYRSTLTTVARLAVPAIADWCVVDLIEDDDSIARVAIEHRDPSRRDLAEALRENYPARPEAIAGPAHAIRSGHTEYQTQIPEAVRQMLAPEPERLQLLTALGLNSYVAVPLRTRGRILGSLTFFTDAGRSLSAADVEVAEDLARRAATAIDNARLYEEAQRAVRAREDVLAVVSHDLRTPLAAIVTAAATQAATAPSTDEGSRVRRRAETIQRSAEHMSRLIADLTDLGQIDSGRLTLDRSLQDPAALAREVVDSLSPVARGRGTLLDVAAPAGVPHVLCDGDRVVQVLSNLVSNAIKVGAPTVTIHVASSPEEVTFTVEDSGPGIATADLPHMFDRYWRGRDTRYKGTGLGLPISKGIVAAHAGRIGVESEPGSGTRFWFTLPRAVESRGFPSTGG